MLTATMLILKNKKIGSLGTNFESSYMYWIASSHYVVYLKFIFVCRIWMNVSVWSLDLDTNWYMATNWPFKHYTLLWQVDDFISLTAFDHFGFTSYHVFLPWVLRSSHFTINSQLEGFKRTLLRNMHSRGHNIQLTFWRNWPTYHPHKLPFTYLSCS